MTASLSVLVLLTVLFLIETVQSTKCITHNTKHLYHAPRYSDEDEPAQQRLPRETDPPPRIPEGVGRRGGRGRPTEDPACVGRPYNLPNTPGNVFSPGFNSTRRYPTDATCRWKIAATRRSVVKITFLVMDLHWEVDCLYDSITVYDGKNNSHEEIGRYCGKQIPEAAISTGKHIYIEFNSDRLLTANRGFVFRYEFVEREPNRWCSSSPTLLSASEGFFVSPKYPNKYPNRANCMWHISCHPDMVVSLTFEKFNLENSNGCYRDSLEVYDGSDTRGDLLGTYCGKEIDKNIRSKGSNLYIRFKSDESKKKPGFKADYSCKRTIDGKNRVDVPCGMPETPQRSMSRVVGGMQVIPHSWPWVVQFRLNHPVYGKTHWCGAVLISSQWVASAMHCTYDVAGGVLYNFASPEYIGNIEMVLGEHDLNVDEGTEVRVNVTKVIIHAGFDNKTYLNDIALFKLQHPVEISRAVMPVCLPERRVADDMLCKMVGWGSTDPDGNGFSNVLNQANVPVIPKEVCMSERIYGDEIKAGMLCAGYIEGHKDACQGDSGGPLFGYDSTSRRFKLYGLISWGFGCARAYKPGVYSDIHYFLDWIYDHIIE